MDLRKKKVLIQYIWKVLIEFVRKEGKVVLSEIWIEVYSIIKVIPPKTNSQQHLSGAVFAKFVYRCFYANTQHYISIILALYLIKYRKKEKCIHKEHDRTVTKSNPTLI